MNICSLVKLAAFALVFGALQQCVGVVVKRAEYNRATYIAPQEQELPAVCTRMPCPVHKVAQPTLPKNAVGKVIRVADTINGRNQRAWHAGE
ncbi:MAG: hypothetical protein ACKO0Z_02325 [Betaproteobacteria bacterium]